MIRFSIDCFEPTSFFRNFDYSNKIILNSTVDTLFIYDKKYKKYIPNACKDYKIKGKKYYLILRDDLYYYDGTRVKVDDYISSLKENDKLLNLNILNISKNNNTIIINLRKKDLTFIKKISVYLCTPHKNKTSGRYYISKILPNKIELLPNKYYRNPAKEKLEFIKLDNLEQNIEYFTTKQIDITNNTFFKLENNVKKKEYSGIIISIEISSKYDNILRKKIVRSINKLNLVNELGNCYFIKNDFLFGKKTKYKYKPIVNNKKLKLKIAYSSFYPNKEIALLIKSELEQNNFEIELMEYNYNEFKLIENYDIKLTLNYFEYIDDYYFYSSKYFKYIMRKNILYSILVSKHIMKKTICKLFKNKYLKEPLLSFYSSYSTNKYTNEFSYLECDYKKIGIDA